MHQNSTNVQPVGAVWGDAFRNTEMKGWSFLLIMKTLHKICILETASFSSLKALAKFCTVILIQKRRFFSKCSEISTTNYMDFINTTYNCNRSVVAIWMTSRSMATNQRIFCYTVSFNISRLKAYDGERFNDICLHLGSWLREFLYINLH